MRPTATIAFVVFCRELKNKRKHTQELVITNKFQKDELDKLIKFFFDKTQQFLLKKTISNFSKKSNLLAKFSLEKCH